MRPDLDAIRARSESYAVSDYIEDVAVLLDYIQRLEDEAEERAGSLAALLIAAATVIEALAPEQHGFVASLKRNATELGDQRGGC